MELIATNLHGPEMWVQVLLMITNEIANELTENKIMLISPKRNAGGWGNGGNEKKRRRKRRSV